MWVTNVSSSSTGSDGLGIWLIISLIIAVIGGIVAYILFAKSKNNFTGFLGWLHKFINFKVLVVEDIIKITYIILASFLTLASFGFIAVNILSFFGMLILGNLVLRITYEMSILLIKICQNTSEINSKLKK